MSTFKDSIRIKRGMSAELPQSLPLGELAFCIDTRELWVGSGDGLALKRVTNTEITKFLENWEEIYTTHDEKFETKYIEVSTQFATKFDEICKQFSVKSDSLDRQFADKFEEICVQFFDKYAGLEAEYAKKLHNIDVLSSDNKESIDLLKRDIGTTENIEDLRQINNLATDTLNDLQAIREDLESDISEIGDFKEDVRKAHIDYSGTHHEKLKDSMDANVDFIMGEFNSVTHTGEYITAQDTILRHIKRAEMRGHTELNCIKEPSGQDLVLPYEFEDTQSLTLQDTKESGAVNIVLKGNTEVNVLKNPMRDYVVPYEFEEGYTATLTDTKETGSIQSAILKGSTLVNIFDVALPTEIKNSHDITLSYQVNANETYTFIVEAESTSEKYQGGFITANGGGNGWNGSVDNGISKFTVTTSEATNKVRFSALGASNTVQIKKCMIIKGDYSNQDIPFFTGMQSVRMPVLKTIGKNLFDVTKHNLSKDVNGDYICTKYYKDGVLVKYDLKPNTTYQVSYTLGDNQAFSMSVNDVWVNNNSISNISFTTDNSGEYFIKIGSPSYTYTNKKIPTDIQIEEGTQATTYEPYKSNILTVNEDVTLRGVGDVKDELNLLTGEAVENTIKLTFSGIENWETSTNLTNYMTFRLAKPSNMITADSHSSASKYVCDKLQIVSSNTVGSTEIEAIWFSSGHMYIRLPKTKASSLEEFKTYLSTNNIQVVSCANQPVVKTVDLSILDQDGLSVPTLSTYNEVTHISTSSQEGSLLPSVSSKTPEFPVMIKPNTKYSIVADTTTNGFDEIPLTYNLGGAEVETEIGNKVTVIQTPSTLENETFKVTGTGMKLSNVMILEKDLTGKEIPNYTEGMNSVKVSEIKTTGKNLVPNSIYPTLEEIPYNHGGIKTALKLQMSPNTTYKFSMIKTRERVDEFDGYNYIVNSDKVGGKMTYRASSPVGTKSVIRVTTNTDGVILIAKYNFNFWEWGDCVVSLDDGTSDFVNYESHKSTTLSTSEEIILRSLPNNVCDTLNVQTGEYVQRIGEYIPTGEESNWFTYIDIIEQTNNYMNETSCCFGFNLKGKVHDSTSPMYCDKLPTRTSGWWGSRHLEDGICGIGDERVFLRVSHKKTGVLYTDNVSTALTKAKTYFAKNPHVILYELAEPIVTKLDLSILDHNSKPVTNLKTWNTKTHFFPKISEGALNPIISSKPLEYEVLLKPNTKYSIITTPISNGHTNSLISFDLGGQQVETTVGSYCTLVTTPNSLTHNKLVMRGKGNKLSGGVMVIEGDKTGMMFNHFDGMKSVENPTVRITNKNLFTQDVIDALCTYENWEGTGAYRNNYNAGRLIGLKPKTSYTVYVPTVQVPPNSYPILMFVYAGDTGISNGTILASGLYSNSSEEYKTVPERIWRFTTPDAPIGFRCHVYNFGSEGMEKLREVLEQGIQIEESSNETEYVESKQNTATFDLPLRSLPNGVKDTLDLVKGEHVQRVDELVLNGSENWSSYLNNIVDDEESMVFSHIHLTHQSSWGDSTKLICDKVVSGVGDLVYYNNGFDAITSDTTKFVVRVTTSKLKTKDVEGFKEWLSENPVTLQYEMLEPVISKVKVDFTDKHLSAYKDVTHIFTDNSSNLNPKLIVDVPTDIVAELSRLRSEKTALETSKASLESQITLLDMYNKELVSEVKQLSETNTQLANETKSLRNITRINQNNLNNAKSSLLEGQKVLEFNQEELQQEQERTRVEQEAQDRQIINSMLASTEIFELVLGMFPTDISNQSQRVGGESSMVEVYVTLIVAGEKTLEQVPAIIRPKVEAQLKALGVLG